MGKIFFAVCVLIFMQSSIAAVSLDQNQERDDLKRQMSNMQQQYEYRIANLETQITQSQSDRSLAFSTNNNQFNPAISIILNGGYAHYSNEDGNISGFAVGEEGERDAEGFGVGESELNFSANIDDKFYGNLTASVVHEDNQDGVELEEAYIQTTPGMGLPTGMVIKAGKALWSLGYINDHHAHTDDFSDRPLPYRVFLDNAFNDVGMEITYVFPTDVYTQIGVGLFRGDDFPFAHADGNNLGAWSAFVRIGGDFGVNQNWRIGASVLNGDANKRLSNEDSIEFSGEQTLRIADMRYTWAPTGNSHQKELALQAEYFQRNEQGGYTNLDSIVGEILDDHSEEGWYAQAVYKFHPQWRVGMRYSVLTAADVEPGLENSVLDAANTHPDNTALMVDWSNSEFSRLRLQFNREQLRLDQSDRQIMLHYIVSIGAHGAHIY